MIDEELAVKMLRARISEWNSLEGHKLDGYEYEKRFIEIFHQFQVELFQKSLGEAPSNKNKKKTVQTTLGQVEVSRGHCLAPEDRFRQSAYLRELALYVGQQEVFDEASETLYRVGRVELSDKSIERLCHHYGEVLEEQEHEDQLVRDIRPHYVMIDGSMVLTREDQWKELKLGRLFPFEAQMKQSPSRGLIHESSYVAHLGDHEAFFEKLYLCVACLSQVVFICDGAKWIWKWVETHFPQAVQILDWFHVIEKVGEFCRLIFSSHEEAKAWLEARKEELWEGRPQEAIDQIKALKLTGKKAQAQERLIGYLQRNFDRIQYQEFRERGYQIGSGPIEAAHRNIIQQRLKRSGQRWSKAGAQQVANLRTTFKGRDPDKITRMVRKAA
jgi:hypothetical protein